MTSAGTARGGGAPLSERAVLHAKSSKEELREERPVKMPILRWWWVVLAATVTAAVVAGLMWWLLEKVTTAKDISITAVEFDAIRTALSVGIGGGGAMVLWLTARRQRSTELQLQQTVRISADSRAHAERVAAATESDLRERRITDMYSRAVDHLGSESAPVRLGGLYLLERLGEHEERHRQTVINIICGYLRMPYRVDIELLHRYYRSNEQDPGGQLEEELQVRLAAQRIIVRHLQFKCPGGSPPNDFWDDIDLDLSGAALVDFRLEFCKIRNANFIRTRFFQAARFDFTVFDQAAWFLDVQFEGANAYFTYSKFDRGLFYRCDFGLMAYFDGCEFDNAASFSHSTFRSRASFKDCKFRGEFDFQKCRLGQITGKHIDKTSFPKAKFNFEGALVFSAPSQEAAQIPPHGWRLTTAKDGQARKFVKADDHGINATQDKGELPDPQG
jgi:hypothetical protein